MELSHTKNIETSSRIKTYKSKDINTIIVKYGLNRNIYNINNTKTNLFLYIRKIRNIILSSMLISVIAGAILFFINFISDNNSKSKISFKRIQNNNDNIDGYYIPKDKLSNPIYKKCSVENCKKCYGNSYNDICISCLNSYISIMNEENKIIKCEYNPLKEQDNNITLKESDSINLSDYFSERETEFNLKSDKKNYEIKTEKITEKIEDNISKTKTELTIEYNSNNIKTFKSESIINNILNIKSELTEEINIKPLTTYIIPVEQSITENIINNCNPGYYLPEGKNNECKPCQEKGCKICHGNSTNNYCDSCFSDYILRYIDNHLTCFAKDKNCEEYNNNTIECIKCNNEFYLIEGKCLAYSISAIYYTKEDNQVIKLIRLNSKYIKRIILDNEIYDGLPNNNYFTIPHRGYHQVYFFITNNPTTFENLFYFCDSLISVNFTSSFNTKNITNLNSMFELCSSLLSVDFSNFDTSNVKSMNSMFLKCHSLSSINLSKFNTRNVESFLSLFDGCFSLKIIDLHNFDIQNITDASYMFYNCYSLTSIIFPEKSENDISLLEYTYYMFFNCTNLTFINFSAFNLNNVRGMDSMFERCINLERINISYYKTLGYKTFTNGIKTIRIPLYEYFKDFYPKNVTSTKNMFKNCFSLQSIDFSKWNLTNIIHMENMFQNCYSLKNITFDNSESNNLAKVKYMSYTFANCNSLEYIKFDNYKYTNNLLSMSHMFENCSSLKEIDISNINITTVEDISFMFSGCISLTYVLFNNSYKNNIKNMNSLFFGCNSLVSINFDNFNTKEVIDMKRMFYNCSSINYLNLNYFNTSNVKYMDEMFYGCSNLSDLYILNFVGTSLISFNDMFNNSNKFMMRYAKFDFYHILNQAGAR